MTIISLIAGILSGIISGIGIGGGTILIPVLIFLIKLGQHEAQAINLLYFIPTAIIALFVHIKNKDIDLKISIPIALFGIIGAIIGAKLAISISGNFLKRTFAIFLFGMGLYEVFR